MKIASCAPFFSTLLNDLLVCHKCTGCSLDIVFFSNNSQKFATSSFPALGCYWLYKNYQPIGVAVHSHCVRALKVSYSDVGKGGVAENCEKTQFFLNTLYLLTLSYFFYL